MKFERHEELSELEVENFAAKGKLPELTDDEKEYEASVFVRNYSNTIASNLLTGDSWPMKRKFNEHIKFEREQKRFKEFVARFGLAFDQPRKKFIVFNPKGV